MKTISRRNAVKTIAAAAAGAAVGGSPLWSSTASAQTREPIRLGLITSLSGSQVIYGEQGALGAQIAADQINKAGGVLGRKLEIVARDDKAKAADGVLAARDLIGSGVTLLLGIPVSSVAFAITPLLEPEKAILLSCGAHSEKLTHDNFTRNYFRAGDNPFMRCNSLAQIAAQRYANIVNWAGLVPDYDYGTIVWQSFQDGLIGAHSRFTKNKPTFSPGIRTPFGAADYRTNITATMGLPADGFLLATYGGDAITLLKQAKPYGFFKKAKLLLDPANEFIVAKALKQDLPDTWLAGTWFHRAYEDVPASRELYAEMVRRTNVTMPTVGTAAETHAAVLLYAAAIQAAGTTETQALISALEAVRIESATGPRYFRKTDHQAIKSIPIVRVRGSATASDGFEVVEFVKVLGEDVIEPASPGKPYQYKYL